MQGESPPGPSVGVVIRTLNEAELIATCLMTLRRQRTGRDVDILVVDSGSTDATVEIARSHGVRVIDLPPDEFDYSKALNLGIEEVQGDLAISLSAHAVPLDDDWVERIAAPFEDPKVAGVACRQVPWPDAPWGEVHRVSRTFGAEPAEYTRTDCGGLVFSNAASCIRRSVWLDQPFTLPAAEDHEWAARILELGWSVVYEPAAAVYHSHRESPRAQALRMIDINRVRSMDNGRPRTHRQTVREAAGLLYRDSRLIVALDEPVSRRLTYLADLLRMVAHYVRDFSRSGTTAERRRDDTTLPGGSALARESSS